MEICGCLRSRSRVAYIVPAKLPGPSHRWSPTVLSRRFTRFSHEAARNENRKHQTLARPAYKWNHESKPSVSTPSERVRNHQPLGRLFKDGSIELTRPSKKPWKRPKNPPKPPFQRFAYSSELTTMSTTVELAVTPTVDTPGTCVQFHHESASYIFGRLSEGTQRAWGSRRMNLGSTKHVFLTGNVEWGQLGGLLGFLLSVATAVGSARDIRVTENEARKRKGQNLLPPFKHDGFGVHGGDNLCHSLAACRGIIFRQALDVHTFEQREDPRAADTSDIKPDWQDGAIRVWKVPVRRARSSSPVKRPRSPSPNVRNGVDTPVDTSSPLEPRLSDFNVAKLVVEKHMFNGQLSHPKWEQRKLSEVKPTDDALTWRGGKVAVYTGPFATEGKEIPNPDDIAYVLTDDKSPSTQTESFPLNHKPLPPTAYSETSMSYIVKCQDRRGKFNAPVAISLGVKRTDFARLVRGETVEGENGSAVTPEMVLGEPIKGKGVIVADISSSDFIDSFMERPEWANGELLADIVTMYWILGRGVAQDARIQKFMAEHSQFRHVLCAQDVCPNEIGNSKAAQLHTQMRCVDADRFPLLEFNNVPEIPEPAAGSNVEVGKSGMRFQLMPRFVENDRRDTSADLTGAANSVDENALQLAREAQAKVSDPEFLAKVEQQEQDIPNRDAEIIPLGTGSSVPSTHRNVSGTLIKVPGIGNYIFDCGEGTIGQIRRAFGNEKTEDVLRDLQCIVVSHLHADHHLGAVTLIRAWYEQTLKDNSNATLAIVCINRYRFMLEELSQVEDFGYHRLRFPSCPWGRDRDVTTEDQLGEENFGLRSIKRVPVKHCWKSYATQLELTSGLRLAYSGDCRPSMDFARECEGAHLLIHECTFDNDMSSDARYKNHSTMGEALEVATEMKARRTLLTHFSQRYSKADSLRHETADGQENSVLLAFDLMRVKLGDFQKAACFIPAIQKLMEKDD